MSADPTPSAEESLADLYNLVSEAMFGEDHDPEDPGVIERGLSLLERIAVALEKLATVGDRYAEAFLQRGEWKYRDGYRVWVPADPPPDQRQKIEPTDPRDVEPG